MTGGSESAEYGAPRRRDRLYGRRKGRPLSSARTGLMETLYPALALDLSTPPPADVRAIFPVRVEAVRVEIGFGAGEHLLAEAGRAPHVGFIGVEPFLNGLAAAVTGIAAARLDNVRLHGGDAADLLDWLPAGSVARVDILYPDPWPKRRHWKRRVFGPENLARLARVMIPGGRLRFASDSDAYVAWALFHAGRNPDFGWSAERADDWRLPYPDWLPTRYEAKARRAGRSSTYLAFTRS